MSPVSSPSSILSSGSSTRTLIDSEKSLGESHTDKTLPDNFEAAKTQIQRTEPIRHSEKHDPSAEATRSKSNADRTLSDKLFFPRNSLEADQDFMFKTIFPRNASLWRSYLRGKTIGQGSYGKVKLCCVDGKPMVIKKSPRVPEEMFYQAGEVAVMKALDHPNIVRSYSASRWLGSQYIAMEYMNGGELCRLGNPKNPQGMNPENPQNILESPWTPNCPHGIPESLVATIMRESLKGLAHMHEQNYIHCDIKIENIFLSKDGEVKIGDFGCAQDSRVDLVQCGGTKEYMPPENVDRICSVASDIWALAITAINLFAGELPTDWNDVYFHMKKKTPPIPPGASSEFTEFLTLATLYDWRERATAGQLLDLPFIKNAPPTSALIPMIQT